MNGQHGVDMPPRLVQLLMDQLRDIPGAMLGKMDGGLTGIPEKIGGDAHDQQAQHRKQPWQRA